MSVSWQNNAYNSAKNSYQEIGTPALTQANPGGTHTFWGSLAMNVLPQMLMGAATAMTGVNIGGLLNGVMSIASCFSNSGTGCNSGYNNYSMNNSIFTIAQQKGYY